MYIFYYSLLLFTVNIFVTNKLAINTKINNDIQPSTVDGKNVECEPKIEAD